MIYITIENNSATFKLDSYKEIVDKCLIIVMDNLKKIILAEKYDKNFKISITGNENKFVLEGN